MNKEFKVLRIEKNNNNLHFPIVCFEGGKEFFIHTSVLRILFPECFVKWDVVFENAKGKELSLEEIKSAYKESPLKYDIEYLNREIRSLKESGIEKGYYRHLSLLSKSIYEFVKQWGLMSEIKEAGK